MTGAECWRCAGWRGSGRDNVFAALAGRRGSDGHGSGDHELAARVHGAHDPTLASEFDAIVVTILSSIGIYPTGLMTHVVARRYTQIT